ncbi:MAG: BatA domain-containing protein [Candidatus Delongbacteria bacterium]|nr:BatA domain-containing protein [Candidatus Delongbacteria bacterium]
MNFIYSQYLFFLPLVIAPLIIYLIFRKKPKQMVFSSLYILKELALKINKKTKLKDILLLIIRTLIVLSIIMFFAAPYFGERSEYDPELETSLYIYLDTSPSMALSDDSFNIFEKSVSTLRKFLNEVPERSEVLIRTSDPTKKFIGSNKDAQLFLNEIKISGMQREISSVIVEADSFFTSKEIELNKEFMIFSDGKIKTNDSPIEYSKKYSKYFIQDRVDVREKNDISIDSVKINIRNQIACYISSKETGKGLRANLELYEQGTKIYSENLKFEDSNNITVIIDDTNIAISDTQMFFKVEDDINSMNNVFYFVLPGTKRIKTLIVGNKEDIVVKSLLVLMNASSDSLFEPTTIDFNNINSVQISDNDIILFTDIKKLSSYTVSQLNNFLRASKSIFIAYGKDLNLNDYNANAIPNLDLPKIKGVNQFTDSYSSINIISKTHPIFNKVFVQDIDPNSMEIYSYYDLTSEGWDIVAKVNNSPYILEKNASNGKIILLSSGFDKELSNIIENGFVVPLIHNSLKYLSQSNISSNISHSYGDKYSLDKGNKLFDPSSNEVSNSSAQKQNVFLDKQGFYSVKNEINIPLKYIAVNNIRENNELISKELLNEFKFIDPETFAKNNIFSVERNNYSYIFLYALILLIVAEMLIARKL